MITICVSSGGNLGITNIKESKTKILNLKLPQLIMRSSVAECRLFHIEVSGKIIKLRAHDVNPNQYF